MEEQSLKLMSINAKAGMEGLDKAAINAIIDEASKGSKFYEAKSKAQKRIDAKKEAMATPFLITEYSCGWQNDKIRFKKGEASLISGDTIHAAGLVEGDTIYVIWGIYEDSED